jgi:hypothetical protein
MLASVTNGGTQKLPQNFGMLEHTDMTIHWKALEKHFLIIPLFLWVNHFFGEKYIFWIFLKKH